MQHNIAKAATAMATAVEQLHMDSAAGVKTAVSHRLNAVSILGHTHQGLSAFRKEAQRYVLPHEYKAIWDTAIGVSSFLYGDVIRKTLHEAKEDKRLASSLATGCAGLPKRQRPCCTSPDGLQDKIKETCELIWVSEAYF